jgi:hypothetical protein
MREAGDAHHVRQAILYRLRYHTNAILGRGEADASERQAKLSRDRANAGEGRFKAHQKKDKQ